MSRRKTFGCPREDEPGDIKLVRRIVHLHDVKGYTWREIGPMIGFSHQAPYLLYKKWSAWYYLTQK
jgi:hypothetical protein